MEQDVMERDVATNRPGHFPKPSTDPLASNAAGKIAGTMALSWQSDNSARADYSPRLKKTF
jgi:hypothetical protein